MYKELFTGPEDIIAQVYRLNTLITCAFLRLYIGSLGRKLDV